MFDAVSSDYHSLPGTINEVRKLLSDSDVDVNCIDGTKSTLYSPLCIASQKGNIKIIKLLMEHGADPTIGDSVIKEIFVRCASKQWWIITLPDLKY